MIITLKGAVGEKSFANSNIGTLSSWRIFTTLGSGCTASKTITTVDKDAQYTNTFTLAENYEVGSVGISVTMGDVAVTSGITQDGQTITITIPKVTGIVYISIPTKNTQSGEEESGNGSNSGSNSGEEDGGSDLTLDSIAYGDKTYREIFINKNMMPDINNNTLLRNAANTFTYKQYTDDYPVSIKQSTEVETNYVPSYYMDASGAQSRYLQREGGSDSATATEGEIFFGGVNIKVTDWTVGRIGINIGTDYSLAVVGRTTNGYERLTKKIAASADAGYFIGSTGKANLTGYINNPVLVRGSIFGTSTPSESEWTTLYNNYCEILCNNT